jgi:hypothetical protein
MFSFVKAAQQFGIDPNGYAGGSQQPLDPEMEALLGGQSSNSTMGMKAPSLVSTQTPEELGIDEEDDTIETPPTSSSTGGSMDVLKQVQELGKPKDLTGREKFSRNMQLVGAAFKGDGGDAVRKLRADFDSQDKNRIKEATEQVALARSIYAMQKDGLEIDALQREMASAKSREAAEKDANSNITKLTRVEAIEQVKQSGLSDELKQQYINWIGSRSAYEMKQSGLLTSIGNLRTLNDQSLDRSIKLAKAANEASAEQRAVAEEGRKAGMYDLDREAKQADVELKKAQADKVRREPVAKPKETAFDRERGKRYSTLALDGDGQLDSLDTSIGKVEKMIAMLQRGQVNAGPIEGNVPGTGLRNSNQLFDKYAAELQLAAAAEKMKGQGTITENERKILAESTASRNADDEVNMQVLADQLQVLQNARKNLAAQVQDAKDYADTGQLPKANKTETETSSAGRKVKLKDGRKVILNENNEVVGSW